MPASSPDPETDALVAEYLKRMGERVADIRALQGLTLSELEELTGIDSSALSRIERGKLNISLRLMVRIAEGLGIRLHELFVPPEQSQIKTKSSRSRSKKTAAGKR